MKETFLEIMLHLTQQYASQLFKNTNQNLQQALILALWRRLKSKEKLRRAKINRMMIHQK
jgi:hypothetical protein